MLLIPVVHGAAQTATVINPAPGAAVSTPTQLSWTQVPNSSAYYVYVGTTPGALDVINTGQITTTSFLMNVPAGIYYIRLWTELNGIWTYSDSSFTSTGSTPDTPSTLLYPANGSTNIIPLVNFSWNAVPAAQSYYLYIGSTPGAQDIYGSGETTSTTLQVQLQPSTKYYVRLWTKINAAWIPSDSSFTAGLTPAKLAYPPDQATGVDPAVPFSWQAVSGALGYSLSIGTTPGGSDVFLNGNIGGTSVVVPGLQAATQYFAHLGTNTPTGWIYVDSSFTAGTGLARLIYPLDGATQVSPTAQFSWNAISDAQVYYLYIGTSVGLRDIYDSGEVTGTSLQPSGMSQQTEYYATMWTKKAGVWNSVNSVFTTGSGGSLIIFPPDKATDVDPNAQFTWSSYPNAQAYYLYVGTTLGAKDVYDGGETPSTNTYVPGLTTGTTYYVRINTKVNGTWLHNDTSFTAGNALAYLTQPLDKSIDVDPYQPFFWSTVSDAQAYYLYIGTAAALNDVYDSGEMQQTSASPPGLVPGNMYYARMWTKTNNVWRYTDSTFQTGDGLAHLTNPSDRSTNVNPFTTFTWSVPPSGADRYYVYIGSAPGLEDIYDSGELTATTLQPRGVACGTTYYVRLWTYKYGVWHYVDSTFSTASQDTVDPDGSLHQAFISQVVQATNNVRMMADPATNIPNPGTALASYLASYNLTVADCDDYAYVLSISLNGLHTQSRLRHVTLTGTNYEAHTTVEYLDPYVNQWAIADPTFGLLYLDQSRLSGQSVEQVSALLNSNQLSQISFYFVTSYGDSVMRSYYLDPITLYANYYSPDLTSLTTNSPLQFLNPVQTTGDPNYYLFQFSDSSNIAVVDVAGQTTSFSPIGNTGWSAAQWLAQGWTLGTIDPGQGIYTPRRLLF